MSAQKWSFKITPFRKILFAIVGFTVLLTIYRLYTGLGVSTNLNDRWPWGLWIGVDLTAVALAGGGYSIAVLVHILHLKKFKSVARRALLFSMLSYVFVLATLILEIGRWDNFWRPIVSWGYHSPMFEVFMCISAYFFLQVIEFAEIVTEKAFKSWHKTVAKVLPVVFILAAILPFGHQASLGAIYLIFPGKLHPLWYTSLLPWFFLISSFFVGPAMVAIETLWSSKIHNREIDTKVLSGLVRISGTIMIGYLALKVYDLISRGALNYVFTGGLEGNMFLLELVIGIIIPIVICFSSWGKTKGGLATFGVLTASGVILNRVNVVFTGMYNALGSGYIPSWIEWGISIGLLAIVVLAYLFIVENFVIFGQSQKQAVPMELEGKRVEVSWQTAK